ncbi:hypothetical protein UFOVP581_32 [uncultured Caudovirales phage]|uniref:Uncharacterized protein n=1 Tax=uncultured Caudovirales phage TaxID=2100421 RepID=A0A6J5PD05_9CAUD|nr:hypothetical protein UFOVP581_32 [uncultured Caudovirales phage]
MSELSRAPFLATGRTIAVAAASTAPAGVIAPVASGQDGGQYRVVNAGTTTVFLGVGATAATAQSASVAPIAGTPSGAIPLLAGAVEILSFGEGAFFSGQSSAAATVYITPGTGL